MKRLEWGFRVSLANPSGSTEKAEQTPGFGSNALGEGFTRAPKREIITEKPDPTPWSISHGELRAQENAKILFLGVCGARGSWIPVDSNPDNEIPPAL